MTNPLMTATAPVVRTDLLAWCDENNRNPITKKLQRWYYVGESDEARRVCTLDGEDGFNVHRLLDGNLPDFVGWSESRMGGYRKWLRGMIDKGLLPASLRVLEAV